MLSPLNIISLDQGKEFARQEIKRLYVEPKESAPEKMTPEGVAQNAVVGRSKWASIVAEFTELWHAGYSVGARRY